MDQDGAAGDAVKLDTITGDVTPMGSVEVPDEIVRAAEEVCHWMRANRVVQLCGLWEGPTLARPGKGGWNEE